jgi:hypothetical protein
MISLMNGSILATQRCRVDVWVTSNTPNPAHICQYDSSNQHHTIKLCPNQRTDGKFDCYGGAGSDFFGQGFLSIARDGRRFIDIGIELINPGTPHCRDRAHG